ncbi:MAG: universal stress protein [Caldilineaceae bacterium]|nr:universal stress protein [Caldilineaceae bacterium]
MAGHVEHLYHLHIVAETMIDIGDPAGKIVDYAAEHDIDLIVMSTHGHTGLTRWRYGSVTTKVLSEAPCPVLVVRPTAE